MAQRGEGRNTATGTTAATARSTSAQSAVIYDVLSEGPIEGLVQGASSIRLNDNPVANTVNDTVISPKKSTDVSYNATNGTLTDNRTAKMMADIATTDGIRYVQIFGGRKRAANSINVVAGNNIITSTNTSTMSFAATDVAQPLTGGSPTNPGSPDQLIRIDGAGEGGGQLVAAITEVINTAAVRVDYAPLTSITNTACYIDLVDRVQTIGASTVTITPTGQGVTVANTSAILSSPIRNTNQTPTYNYQNFGFAFRTGERDQQYLPTPAGIGSASIAFNVSGGDIATTSGTGYPSPSAFGLESPTENYTGTALVVTSSQMGIGNPAEIDKVRCTLGFNSLISQRDTGAIGVGFAEYRISFGYSRDGGSNFTDVVKIGRETVSTSTSRYHGNTATKDTSSGIVRRKTLTPFNQVYEFDLSEHQPFDSYRLTFERLSPINQKENGWTQTNSATIKSVENIITDKLSYPYSAYAAVVVDAEEFTSIPKRSYLIRGLKVKVPTNYFPIDSIDDSTGARRTAAAYTRNVTDGTEESSVQDWDGNFRGDTKEFPTASDVNHDPVYSNNPIWVFMDLLTNNRYGVGKYINEEFDFSMVDKYTLFQLAKYCDELVPDGIGGFEPRFTCNLYLTKDATALKVLQNLASLVRGMLIWHGGQVTLGSSIQKGSVYTFSKSNVIGGEFSYAGTANRFRTNQIAISWNNPENGYKQEVEVVEDHDEIARTGKFRRKNITAYGCTSRGQAIRLGKFHLLTEKLEKETITFKTGLNAAMLKPGDVIDVQDSDIHDVVASGRVTTSSASTTTFIKTDRDVTGFLNADDAFKLHLIYPSGGCYLSQTSATINSTSYVQGDLILLDEGGATIDTQAKAANLIDDAGNTVITSWSEDVRVETQTVDFSNSTSAGIKVTSAFTSVPNGEVIFTLSGQEETGAVLSGSLEQYIVLSIKEDTKEMGYSITAADYSVEKFDEVDRGYVVPELPDIRRLPKRDDQVPTVTGLTAKVVRGDGAGGENSVNTSESTYSIIVSWNHPTTGRTEEDGTAIDDVYEHLAGYNLQHNILTGNEESSVGDFITEQIRTTEKTEFVIKNVVPGDDYIVRVQTLNTNSFTSGYVQTTIDFPPSIQTPSTSAVIPGGLNGGIQKGGILTTPVNIDSTTGTITLASDTYTFTPPNGIDTVIVTSANTNFTQQTFPSMSDGDKAFLLFDHDGNTARGTTRTDVLRPIKLVTDTTAADPDSGAVYNYTFIARQGQASNDLAQATGTVATTKGENLITGTGTNFDGDYAVGELIAIGAANANRFMTRVAFIESDTSLTLEAPIPHTLSSANIFKQNLKIDLSKDTVIGEVQRNGSTYTYIPFTNKQTAGLGEIADNAVTSGTIAQNSITIVQLAENSISGAQIRANTIVSANLTAGQVENVHIAAGAITDAKIAANTITAASIAAGSITTGLIAADAITDAKIAANTITNASINAGTIGTAEIGADAITNAKIASNAIENAQIKAGSIDTAEIAADAITNAKIGANAIENAQIKAGSVDTAEIAADAITNAKIEAGAVDTAEIAANAITNAKIEAGSVNTASIGADAITNAKIAADAIGTAEIQADAITNSEIAADAIGTAEIQADAITNSEIAANAIDTAEIQAGAITGNEITAGAIGSVAIAANAITSTELKTNAVGSVNIVADAITNVEIAANAVESAQIKAGSVTGTIIASGGVGTTQLATGSVTGIIIADGAISAASKLANNVINASKILSGAVAGQQLADNAVSNAKIALNSVNTSELISDAVTGDIIAANAVDTAQIKSDSIGSAAIIAGSIGSSEVAANAIDTNNIVADAIDSSHISANSINTNAIVTNSIDSSHISANSIGTNAIVADAIDSSHISANSIDSNAIIADSIDSSHVSVNAINSSMIIAGNIDSSHIGANQITAAAVVAGSITNSEIAGNTINSAVIQAGAVTNPQIGANAITTAKIAAGNVDTAEIAANAITNAKIEAGSITNASINASAAIGIAKISIGTGAIDIAKIAIGTGDIDIAKIAIGTGDIDVAKIAIGTGDIDFAKISVGNGNITNAMIGAVGTNKLTGTITNAQIGADQITSAKIAANAIDSAEIKSGSIDSVHIGADQITSAKIAANAIDSAEIKSGSIDTVHIGADQITSAKIAANAIDSAEIKSGSVDDAMITAVGTNKLSGTISSAQIAADAITNAKIAANAIDTAEIKADSITNVTIAANAVGAAQISAIRSEKIDVDTLNVKHFANASADIINQTGGTVPLRVTAENAQWNGFYPGSTVNSTEAVYMNTTLNNVRNGAGYQVIYSAVLGDVRNGTIQYSFNGTTWTALSPAMNADAGTFRTYVFVWQGTLSGMSSSQETVYWRVKWNNSGSIFNSTYQAIYIDVDNTQ